MNSHQSDSITYTGGDEFQIRLNADRSRVEYVINGVVLYTTTYQVSLPALLAIRNWGSGYVYDVSLVTAPTPGAPTPAPSPWVSIGIGICTGHDEDWTSADALGPNWGLHAGLGWRMCDSRSDAACQQVCDATAECNMISNSGCCFLFKGDVCNLDTSYSAYQSYSKSDEQPDEQPYL
jgi:hypothetical protein